MSPTVQHSLHHHQKPRSECLSHITHGTYAGTDQLVEDLIGQSKHTGAWRPIRAAAIRTTDGADGQTEWMTPEELAHWRHSAATLGRSARPSVKPYEAIGLSGTQFRRRLKGAKRITKSEALACSHYLLGWATPVPAGDSAAFADWFYPRFGGTECIGEWLEVRPRALCDRLRGFEVRDGQRIKRGPETSLVRALDWVWRIGPACPYGAVKRAPAWPDQKTL